MEVTPDTRAQKIARYWKFILAVLGGVVIVGNDAVGVVVDGYGDGSWDSNDTTTVIVVIITALGVLLKSNRPPGTDGVLYADLSDPTVDRYKFESDGPPENLVGKDFVSFRVVKKLD